MTGTKFVWSTKKKTDLFSLCTNSTLSLTFYLFPLYTSLLFLDKIRVMNVDDYKTPSRSEHTHTEYIYEYVYIICICIYFIHSYINL